LLVVVSSCLMGASQSILTLYPSTTLFRSDVTGHFLSLYSPPSKGSLYSFTRHLRRSSSRLDVRVLILRTRTMRRGTYPVLILVRSEEHTSELQSRENLVCRLLLEKKNS